MQAVQQQHSSHEHGVLELVLLAVYVLHLPLLLSLLSSLVASPRVVPCIHRHGTFDAVADVLPVPAAAVAAPDGGAAVAPDASVRTRIAVREPPLLIIIIKKYRRLRSRCCCRARGVAASRGETRSNIGRFDSIRLPVTHDASHRFFLYFLLCISPPHFFAVARPKFRRKQPRRAGTRGGGVHRTSPTDGAASAAGTDRCCRFGGSGVRRRGRGGRGNGGRRSRGGAFAGGASVRRRAASGNCRPYRRACRRGRRRRRARRRRAATDDVVLGTVPRPGGTGPSRTAAVPTAAAATTTTTRRWTQIDDVVADEIRPRETEALK